MSRLFPHQFTCYSVFIALLFSGCALPEGDTSSPEKVHYRALHLREQGNWPELWKILHPEVRDRFEQWFQAERGAMQRIDLLYPENEQKRALEFLDGGVRGRLKSKVELFVSSVEANPPEPLTRMASWGARVRNVKVEGTQATLRTWADDELVMHQGDDLEWYVFLLPEELQALDKAIVRARANRAIVDRNIDRLRGVEEPVPAKNNAEPSPDPPDQVPKEGPG
jgi:hypothetical protein